MEKALPPAENVELIPEMLVQGMIDHANDMLAEWIHTTEDNMTLLERRRKTGPGNSNYGFVDKVSDVAVVNPEYAGFINVTDLKNAIRNIEACRDLFAAYQSLSRAVTNTMLVYSTEAFRLALDYYRQVKLRADSGDPKAIELYRLLKTRFRKSKPMSNQPTNKEVERHIREIMEHKKDGEVLVKGTTPKLIAGKTEVIDDIHTGRAKFKGREEGRAEN